MTQQPDDWGRRFAEIGRQEKARARKPQHNERQNGYDRDGNRKPEPLQVISASTLKGKQKDRETIDMAGIFPVRNVAILYGDGAVGKSLLAMQLALACTTGTPWLGIEVNQGPVIYFAAEDDAQEITNRLNEICDADGIDLAEAWRLHLLFMAGKDTVLAVEKGGVLGETALFAEIEAIIADIQPAVVFIDNIADTFSGDENKRSIVQQFVSKMRGVCIRHDTTIVMVGHPSQAGMQSGKGTSGSTAWSNSCRCRLYLTRPDGADADPNDRILEVMKVNYGQAGTRFEIKWENHRFKRTQFKGAFDRITLTDVDRVKAKFSNEHWRVSAQSDDWGGYAVAEILGWDAGRYIKAKDFTANQTRNRKDISTYLASWVSAKTLYVVDGRTAKREITKFYSTKPPENVL